VILEPCGRNTAVAITMAALHKRHQESDPLLLIMPADHVVRDRLAFRQAVMDTAGLALDGALVTFGIIPEHAETGYGYIRAGSLRAGTRARDITAFVEKPDRATAERYLASGDYFWNSGIFLIRASAVLEEVARYAPDILEACEHSYRTAERSGSFVQPDAKSFAACRAESFDYAVMERTQQAVVRPVSMGWSDIGSWDSLWQAHAKDDAGNAVTGDALHVDTQRCFLRAGDRTLAALGVEDLVVVDTDHAVLIAHRSRSQDVKKLAERFTQIETTRRDRHRTVHRPWGTYRSIDSQDRFQVKRISVNPGAKLSLQMHYHRAEHWVVVRGTARVTIDDRVFVLSENESTYIPLGARHRLENPGRSQLELIEVQSGNYLGEDDIVRFDDDYGRATAPKLQAGNA
jgi:mannose-1-phosphate guanylyltransferase/mannose-6-phosphate isomerase